MMAAARSEDGALDDVLSYGVLAERLYAAGQVSEARATFEEALACTAAPPETPECLRRAYAHVAGSFAMMCEEAGDFAKAEALYETGLLAYPRCPTCLGNLPVCLGKRAGDRGLEVVEEAYVRALEEYPVALPSVMVKYASFLRRRLNKSDRAEAVLLGVLDTHPEYADALAALAVLLHAERPEDGDRIRHLYERAVRSDPNNANTLSNFGLFFADVDVDVHAARERYEAALLVDPNHANASYNYAVLLDRHLKDTNAALAMYRRALEAQPDHVYALYNLAVMHEEKLRSPHKALDLYRRAAAASPHDPVSHAELGRCLAQLEVDKKHGTPFDFTEADRHLRRALALSSNKNATALAALGEIALSNGDIPDANAKLRAALDADPNNASTKRLAAHLQRTPPSSSGK